MKGAYINTWPLSKHRFKVIYNNNIHDNSYDLNI